MDYQAQQKIKNIERMQEIISDLPGYTLDFFNYYLSIKEASPRTVLNYAYDIRMFYQYLADVHNTSIKEIDIEILRNLKPLDVQNYIASLNATNSTPGKSRKLASLRSFYRYMHNIGRVQNNPALLVATPNQHKKNIIKLDSEEVGSFLSGVKTGDSLTEEQKQYAQRTHYRDYAIVTLLLGTGIRVSECVGIDLSDINWSNNSIRVVRKGGNEQLVYFNEQVRNALEDYIDFERKESEDDKDALFYSRKGMRLSVRSVERLVKKYSAQVVPNKHITPHKLRSTYGTNLYQSSGDIYLTADALGHKNIAVTAEHYADIGNSRRQSTVKYTDEWLK